MPGGVISRVAPPSAGAVPHELTRDAMELVARRFRALADPARLQLLNALRDGEMTVGALVEATGQSTTGASRQLQLLHRSGFVRRRRERLFVWYALADERILRLCEIMCDRIDRDAVGRAARARPGAMRQAGAGERKVG